MARSTVLGFLAVLAVLWLAVPAPAQPPTTSGGSGQALLNLDNTVAAHGYDVVAYFNQNRARRGSSRIKQRLGMATYYFASSRNRYQFLGDAPKYQPQFGGYCAMAMAVGRLEDIDPQVFAIYRGKLYLFRDEGARAAFFQRPDHAILEATANYFEIARDRRGQ
jgi:YHS domain-containing protein